MSERYKIKYRMLAIGPMASLREEYYALLSFLPGLRRIITIGEDSNDRPGNKDLQEDKTE
jgi:hypothetical protein